MRHYIILIISLLYVIPAFSQEASINKILKNYHSVNDSLVEKKIIDFSVKHEYIKIEDISLIQDIDIYNVNLSNKKIARNLTILLFTIPSFQEPIDWGIAIKYKENISIYSYSTAGLTRAILYLINIAEKYDESIQDSIIHAIYSILNCTLDEYLELIKEKIDEDYYNYNVSNWVHIRKNKEKDFKGILPFKISLKHKPDSLLKKQEIKKHRDIYKKVERWELENGINPKIKEHYYKLLSDGNLECYFLELLHDAYSQYVLIIRDKKGYNFYLLENTYVAVVLDIEKYIFRLSSQKALNILKILTLIDAYYYGGYYNN